MVLSRVGSVLVILSSEQLNVLSFVHLQGRLGVTQMVEQMAGQSMVTDDTIDSGGKSELEEFCPRHHNLQRDA